MKELWFREYELRVMELIDSGLSEEAAYTQADGDGDLIYNRAVDRIADAADDARKRAREEA